MEKDTKDIRIEDDLSEKSRELCRRIKDITEDQLKNEKNIKVGVFEFNYRPAKDYGEIYDVINYATGEVLSSDNLDTLKKAIKYDIYLDEKYHIENHKKFRQEIGQPDDDIGFDIPDIEDSPKKADKSEVIHYDDLEITIYTDYHPATREEPEEWDEDTFEIEYDYKVSRDDLVNALADIFALGELEPEIAKDVESLDYNGYIKYLDEHLDELKEKFNSNLQDYFYMEAKEEAEQAAQENYNDR